MLRKDALQEKGVYTLLIRINPATWIEVGRLGRFKFSGLYAYTGSAIGKGSSSLGGRISRHLSKQKKMRWHIDYLLEEPSADVKRIVSSLTSIKRKECEVSQKILDLGGAVFTSGFGSSDCSCNSHLTHFAADQSQAVRIVLEAHRSAGLKPRMTKTARSQQNVIIGEE